MTKKEKELLEEIAHLEGKLAHAETWMARQVAESSSLISKGFFSRIKRKHTLWDNIVDTAEKIRHFHLFKRHYTFWELWQKRFEAFLVGAAIILFWRGIWNLADQFLFPGDANKTLSAVASLLIGMGLMMLTRSFVNQFLDEAVEEAE